MDTTLPIEQESSWSLRNFGPLFEWGICLLPVLGYFLGGGSWYWMGPALFFVILPLLDPLVGRDTYNVPEEQEAEIGQQLRYRAVLWLYFPIQAGVMIFSYSLITSGTLSWPEICGLTLSMSIGTGIGFLIGHELGHHVQQFDRFMGVMILAPVNVADFYIYHNFGHHNWVSTPEDNGSSKYGESFWAFLVRSLPRKSISAWKIEADRLGKHGKGWLSFGNRMIGLTLLSLSWLVGLTIAFGLWAIPLFFACFLISRSLLVYGDYVEHYGLCRRKMANGEYEAPRPEHSWNDNFLLSNMLFCSVDRHSDHHANGARPYQILRNYQDVPQLPLGYISLVPIAMIPPLWRRLIDPLCHDLYDRGLVIPNALPGKLPEKYAAMVTTGE